MVARCELPFVQKQLEAVAGGSSKIRTNVNADEAAVLGAAFKAAGLSPSFRVKDIRADDAAGFDLRLRSTADGKEHSQKLFTQRSFIGTQKQVPFSIQEDFTFEFSQVVDHEHMPILEVQVFNLTASVAQLKDKYSCTPANVSTKITMRLSPVNGLPEIISGSVSCEVEATKEGTVLDNVKGLFGFGSKKAGDQEPLKEDDTFEEDDASASTSTTSATSSSASSSSTTEKTTKSSSTTIVTPLHITSRPLGLNLPLSNDQLNRIRTRLANFDSSDQARIRRAEALNTLEAFTYRARDYLTDNNFITYSPKRSVTPSA